MLLVISVWSWAEGLLKMFILKMPAWSAATKPTEAKTTINTNARIARFFFISTPIHVEGKSLNKFAITKNFRQIHRLLQKTAYFDWSMPLL